MESKDEIERVLNNLNSIEQKIEKEQTNKKDTLGSTAERPQTKKEGIKKLLESTLPQIQVFGIGGAGNNTVTNLRDTHRNVETIAVNTDGHQLLSSDADEHMLIGKETCEGHGAGNRPKIGEKAAKESAQELKNKVMEGDLIFLTCGLGGGTGTGATPYIAKLANSLDKTVVSVCTLPFAKEGKLKMQNAQWGLKRILEYSDTKIIVPNEKLLQVAPNVGILQAFMMVDSILVKAIRGISDLIADSDSVINVDYEDIRKTLSSGGISLIGIGEVSTEVQNKGKALVEDAIKNPLLQITPNTAKNALLNIYGGNSLSLQEATDIVGSISELIGNEKETIWGLTVKDNFSDRLRAVVMLSGIHPTFLDSEGKVDLTKFYSVEKIKEKSAFEKIPKI